MSTKNIARTLCQLIAVALVAAACTTSGTPSQSNTSGASVPKALNPSGGDHSGNWLWYQGPASHISSSGGWLRFKYPPSWRLQPPAIGYGLKLNAAVPEPSGFLFGAIISYWDSTSTPFCTTASLCMKADDYLHTATTTTIGGFPGVKGIINAASQTISKEPIPEGDINVLLDETHGYNISYAPLDATSSVELFDEVLSTIHFGH